MNAPILTEAQVAQLRKNVATSHQKRTFTGAVQWIQYVGGPLDEIKSVVAASAATSMYLGWCIVLDRLGPVTVLYTPSANPAIWNFHSIEVGVQSPLIKAKPNKTRNRVLLPAFAASFWFRRVSRASQNALIGSVF